MNKYEELIEKALEGDKVAIGRLLSMVENSPKLAGSIISKLSSKKPSAHVIGITGIPGSGKSTLISRLITNYLKKGKKVAVIAIDPTSPLSKGALLGDRIRMQEHATDPNVFIRSVSTLGLKGGLSFSGVVMIEVFDKLGFDKIFIESIGVGQADTDIMNVAHTIVVVASPGLGDDIQALKAGIMEIGDIYVLNKSDKPEANKAYYYLEFALESGEIGVTEKKNWNPKLLKTSAVMGEGVDKLVRIIDEHLDYIQGNDLFNQRIVSRRRLMIQLLAEKMFIEEVEKLDKQISLRSFEKEDLYLSAVKLIYEVTKRLVDNLD